MRINKPSHQWQLTFEGDWPTSVAFVGDGRRVAAGNRTGQIYLWELPENPPEPKAGKDEKKENGGPANFAPVRRFDGHTNGITHLRVTPDGQTLVSASLDHTVRLWDLTEKPSGSADAILDIKQRKKKAYRKSKEEQEAILNAPGIEVATVTASHVLDGHGGWVFGLGMSANGKRLISGDDQCLSIIWDLASRKQISRWHGHDRVWVRSAALSPDGKTAFTCEYAGRRSSFDAPAAQVRLWNANDGSLKRDLLKVWTPKVKEEDRKDSYGYMRTWSKLLKRGLVCAEFSSDGKLLAVGQGGESSGCQVHLIDVESGKILRTVSGHASGVCDVKFSADGKYVLSSGRDTAVRICQVSDGKEVATLGKGRGGQFKDWMHAITISPDQKTVAAADIAGLVHVWQLDS